MAIDPLGVKSIADFGSSLVGLASEFIEDPDKRIEYQFKAQELNINFMQAVTSTVTIPWVDALVKLMYAFIAILRPLGSAAMTAFGIYAHYKQIPIDGAMHAVLDGAFPAWGASRHMNKHKEQEEITKRERVKAFDVLGGD